jgi:hypothetical protein
LRESETRLLHTKFFTQCAKNPSARKSVHAQVTLLREYSQGVGEMTWVLPTGAYDPRRHGTPLAAGQAELSEEASQLRCQTLTTEVAMIGSPGECHPLLPKMCEESSL